MNKNSLLILNSETHRYALFGVFFGFLFPILGTLLNVVISRLPITLINFINVQQSEPMLWVIDTAPVFLGLFAGYAGQKQDLLLKSNDDLNTYQRELKIYQSNLEDRVNDRTREIKHRSNLLKAVAEVGKSITTYRNLPELLQQTTYLIHENFGFYHVGIFLLDDRKEFAVLVAANSDGGQRMLERNHQLKIGETGIVGYVTEKIEARIASDVGKDAFYFNNPDLPNTRSELALPLVVSGQVLGALDVQSLESQTFAEEDVATLQILAEQLAVAIQNAHLFNNAQKALEASKLAFGEVSREAWGKILRNQMRSSFLATPQTTIQISSETIEPGIMKAVETGDIILGSDNLTISVPIKVRGLAIGAIRLKKNDTSDSWTQDETNLAITLSEQISGALESARLYKESQQRAAREVLVSNISSRISAFSNIETILRETVHEIGQSIGNSSVTFQLLGEPDGKKQVEGQVERNASPNATRRGRG